MSVDEKPTWERVRIKTKYAEIIRQVAASREENFVDALYHIVDTYWQSQRNSLPKPAIPISITTEKTVDKPVDKQPKSEPLKPDDIGDIDLDGFA